MLKLTHVEASLISSASVYQRWGLLDQKLHEKVGEENMRHLLYCVRKINASAFVGRLHLRSSETEVEAG